MTDVADKAPFIGVPVIACSQLKVRKLGTGDCVSRRSVVRARQEVTGRVQITSGLSSEHETMDRIVPLGRNYDFLL